MRGVECERSRRHNPFTTQGEPGSSDPDPPLEKKAGPVYGGRDLLLTKEQAVFGSRLPRHRNLYEV